MESLKIPHPMLNPSCFSSRRSHLDSASYRTLLRIFSLCLHDEEPPYSSQEQPHDPNPNRNPTLDSSSSEKAVAFASSPPQASADPNPTLQIVGGYQTGEGTGDRNVSSELENFDAFEGLDDDDDDDDDASIDTELLEGIMEDCTRLINEEQQETYASLNANSEKAVTFTNSSAVEEQGKAIGFENEIGQETGINTDIHVSSHSQGEMLSILDDLKGQEGRNEERGSCDEQLTEVEKSRETEEGSPREACPGFDPLTECFGSRGLVSSSVDSEGIEEGEIPDDFENANKTLDSINEHANFEDENPAEGSGLNEIEKNVNPSQTMPSYSDMHHIDAHRRLTEFYSSNSGPSTLIHHSGQRRHGSNVGNADIHCKAATLDKLQSNGDLENLANYKFETPAESEDVEVRVRKKRGPGNEERKARRKIAKKRKRAQKEREQGVKRLKLQPTVKPKEKVCNYYMNGRCQQGDKCKFSHNAIPLTKSTPCMHLARGSCLKGIDCPYDHQLSNHPCHNYMLNGTCSRGDRCKFSHKLPIMEGSSPATTLSISDPLSSSAKSNLEKQLHMNRGSAVVIDQPNAATSGSQFMMHKPLAGKVLNTPKKPLSIPDGIRFLSFGKRPSDIVNQRKNNLHLVNHGAIPNRQSQQKSLVVGQKDNLSSAQQSVPTAQCGQNKIYDPVNFAAIGSKKLNGGSFVAEPAGVPSSSLQREIIEASKILDEFLFGGSS